jgi:hypothetical protein
VKCAGKTWVPRSVTHSGQSLAEVDPGVRDLRGNLNKSSDLASEHRLMEEENVSQSLVYVRFIGPAVRLALPLLLKADFG